MLHQEQAGIGEIPRVDKLVYISAASDQVHLPVFFNELKEYGQQPESSGIGNGWAANDGQVKIVLIAEEYLFPLPLGLAVNFHRVRGLRLGNLPSHGDAPQAVARGKYQVRHLVLDRHLRQLLAGHVVLVHVVGCDHRVEAGERCTDKSFPFAVRRTGAGDLAPEQLGLDPAERGGRLGHHLAEPPLEQEVVARGDQSDSAHLVTKAAGLTARRGPAAPGRRCSGAPRAPPPDGPPGPA